MTNTERRYALAGLWIAALSCAAAWLALPQIQKVFWPQPVNFAAQEVDWVPADPVRGTGVCIDRCAEFISWDIVQDEIKAKVLPQISHIPPGSSLQLLDSRGRRNWVIQVNAPDGAAIAHLWIGNNPASSWSYDGLVHVGSPKAPVNVWGSFQRYSNGVYRRRGQLHGAEAGGNQRSTRASSGWLTPRYAQLVLMASKFQLAYDE
jgi:hypothetical protein